jgi:hypothetical protein
MDDAVAVRHGRTPLSAVASRIDVRTGVRRPWRPLMPADPAGLIGIGSIAIAADGQSYAYSYRRVTSSDLSVRSVCDQEIADKMMRTVPESFEDGRRRRLSPVVRVPAFGKV